MLWVTHMLNKMKTAREETSLKPTNTSKCLANQGKPLPKISTNSTPDLMITLQNNVDFFVTNPHPFLGASADRLVGNDGVNEVKKIYPRDEETTESAILRLT